MIPAKLCPSSDHPHTEAWAHLMQRKSVVVRNKAGIHCRPSSAILMEAQKFPACRIKVKSRKGESELNSILSLISLGLCCGDEVTVEADGANEKAACEKMAEMFAFEFDFPLV